MTVAQHTFREALLNAELPVPDGLSDKSGCPAGARFSVYRNNVVVSLKEAMSTAFPLVQKLIGAQTFDRLSGLYVRAFPPKSPLMMFYGAEFPAFLEAFEPLKHIGYLPDCARLDLALRTSYHAADASSLDPSTLQAAIQDDNQLVLRPKPSTQVVRSRWPLYDIWRFNMIADAPKPAAVAQDVLVTRTEFDPEPHLLAEGGADWYAALEKGENMSAATEETSAHHPGFDLANVLTQALSTQALQELTTKET